MWDVVLDALTDGVKVLPFLFLIHVLMEVIENARNKEKIEKALSGAGAPVMASLLGVVPECGFAVATAKLYDKGLIKTGTLVAAFLAASDEGLIVLVSSGVKFAEIITFIGIKVIYAVLVGELLNILFRKKDEAHVCPEKDDCIECGEHHAKPWDKYLLHPLFHAAKTDLFIIALNFAFGLIIHFIGEDRFYAFLGDNVYFQPLLATIVGLIPNCASSILIAQSFVRGAISFSALLAGLSSNAGLGILILLKDKKNVKKSLFILLSLFVASLVLGYATMLIKF